MSALILLGFALRLYRLDYFPLRGDESFTVLFVQKPFAQMWGEIQTVEPNPPLLYLLLRGWIILAGAGEFATRYFSLFWGVLCIPLVYVFARQIFSISRRPRLIAVLAAFLLAINPYQIWHSQDVRNYTMWPALSLLALIFFWRWIHMPVEVHSRRRLSLLAGFVLAELAALYTHYYEVFILLALNLYVVEYLWKRHRTHGWKSPALAQWIGAQVTLALLYLPFPLLLSNRVSSYGEGSGKQGLAVWDIWQRTFKTFILGETLDANIGQVAWIGLALALVIILVVRWRRERRGLFFLLYVGIPTGAVFALNLVRPLFLERYLNAIAPAYYLLFAWGIIALAGNPPRLPWLRRGAQFLALALFVLLALFGLANYFYNPAYAKSPDWRGLARAIEAAQQPGDVILQNFPETSLLYYERTRTPLVVYPRNYFPDKQTAPALAALNGEYRRIWFIPAASDYWDPDEFVETWLDRHDDLQSETRVGTFRLELYSTPVLFLRTMQPVGATLGKFCELVGYRLERQGDIQHLVMYWRAFAATKKRYNVFVHLVGAQEEILSKIERAPVDGTFPTDQWGPNELIVDGYDVPPNDQARGLQVGMYDPATSRRLPVGGGADQPLPDAVYVPLNASK